MANYVFNKVVGPNEWMADYGIIGPKGEATFRSGDEEMTVRWFLYEKTDDGREAVLFATRWQYPIKAILNTIGKWHDLEWYAVEENCIYASRFYWNDGVKEDVAYIDDDYGDWLGDNKSLDESFEFPNDGVWYFLSTSDIDWINWPDLDGFTKYGHYEEALEKYRLWRQEHIR